MSRTALYKIERTEDGTWLILRTKTGKTVILNIQSAAEYIGGALVQDIVKEWCEEVVPKNTFNSANEKTFYE